MTNKQITIKLLLKIVKDNTSLFLQDFNLGLQDSSLQDGLIDTLFSVDESSYKLGLVLAKQQKVKLHQPIFRLLKSAHQAHKDREFGAATMTKHGKIEVRIKAISCIDKVSAELNISGRNCGILIYKDGNVVAYHATNLIRKILLGL